MFEQTICIGKRCYNSERQALKALKRLDRRVSKKLEKAKQKEIVRYDNEE